MCDCLELNHLQPHLFITRPSILDALMIIEGYKLGLTLVVAQSAHIVLVCISDHWTRCVFSKDDTNDFNRMRRLLHWRSLSTLVANINEPLGRVWELWTNDSFNFRIICCIRRARHHCRTNSPHLDSSAPTRSRWCRRLTA